MDSQPDQPLPLHLVFFPFLARSHIIPMLETVRIAAERGVRATLITTPANDCLIRPTINRANMDLRLIPFPTSDFSLPEGLENITDLPRHLTFDFYCAVSALRPSISALLHELRPDALVSDALYDWTTAVAAEHGVPRLIFQVTGLFPLCAANDVDLHRPHEQVISVAGEPFSIPGFPHPVKLTRGQLPEVFKFPEFLDVLREAELTSYGVVVNSFYALEPDYAEHYYKVGPRKVFLVGPVALAGGKAERRGEVRDPCLSWLDSKEDRSVVYVSFGTLSRFSEEQLRELALGLEESGHAFVWVVRSDGGREGWLPEGYEERVAGRGVVVRWWAPQAEILAHRAVGGYVIHCGWNSVMEAVCAGVPMVTWPLHSEQFVIEKLLVDVLGVATPMWEGVRSVWDEEKEVVRAETVASSVARLMGGGEEVEAMRRRVRELGEQGRRAVAEGGSSYADMGGLLDGLTVLRDERNKSVIDLTPESPVI